VLYGCFGASDITEFCRDDPRDYSANGNASDSDYDI
jgi:hypothetical protein